MGKIKIAVITFLILSAMPFPAAALQVQDFLQPGVDLGFSAQAYLVANRETGEVLLSKNSQTPRVPASLTKLITLLTVLDTKPNLNKSVAITVEDQSVGQCKNGELVFIRKQAWLTP